MFDEGVWEAEIRVGVDFDEPNPEVLVYHEVVAEEFETRLVAAGV